MNMNNEAHKVFHKYVPSIFSVHSLNVKMPIVRIRLCQLFEILTFSSRVILIFNLASI